MFQLVDSIYIKLVQHRPILIGSRNYFKRLSFIWRRDFRDEPETKFGHVMLQDWPIWLSISPFWVITRYQKRFETTSRVFVLDCPLLFAFHVATTYSGIDVDLTTTTMNPINGASNVNMFECIPSKEVSNKSSPTACRTVDNRLSVSGGGGGDAHLSATSVPLNADMTQPSISCLTLFASGGPISDTSVASVEHVEQRGGTIGALSHSGNYYLNSARASEFSIFPKLSEQQQQQAAHGSNKPLSFESCSISNLYPVLSSSTSLQLAVC